MVAEKYEQEPQQTLEKPQKRRFTWEEYVEFDANAEWKYEWIDGRVCPVGWPHVEIFPDDVRERPEEIRAMAGAHPDHVRITMSVSVSLGNQLRGSPCEPFGGDIHVKVDEAGRYVYPDVTVACDPVFEEGRLDLLLNPTVIIEVLSPSTRSYDRADKWELYQRLPSLRDYLMISSEAPRIEWHSRDDGGWSYRVIEGLEAELALSSINCALRLSEVYERVRFAPQESNQKRESA